MPSMWAQLRSWRKRPRALATTLFNTVPLVVLRFTTCWSVSRFSHTLYRPRNLKLGRRSFSVCGMHRSAEEFAASLFGALVAYIDAADTPMTGAFVHPCCRMGVRLCVHPSPKMQRPMSSRRRDPIPWVAGVSARALGRALCLFWVGEGRLCGCFGLLRVVACASGRVLSRFGGGAGRGKRLSVVLRVPEPSAGSRPAIGLAAGGGPGGCSSFSGRAPSRFRAGDGWSRRDVHLRRLGSSWLRAAAEGGAAMWPAAAGTIVGWQTRRLRRGCLSSVQRSPPPSTWPRRRRRPWRRSSSEAPPPDGAAASPPMEAALPANGRRHRHRQLRVRRQPPTSSPWTCGPRSRGAGARTAAEVSSLAHVLRLGPGSRRMLSALVRHASLRPTRASSWVAASHHVSLHARAARLCRGYRP